MCAKAMLGCHQVLHIHAYPTLHEMQEYIRIIKHHQVVSFPMCLMASLCQSIYLHGMISAERLLPIHGCFLLQDSGYDIMTYLLQLSIRWMGCRLAIGGIGP